jgi:hypothetical protein
MAVLDGRLARCHCGAIALSATFIAEAIADDGPNWFEYRGPYFDREEIGCRECGMDESRHPSDTGKPDHAYELDTRDEPFDLFYCGCCD